MSVSILTNGILEGTMIESTEKVNIYGNDIAVGANLITSAALGVYIEATSGSSSENFSVATLQAGKTYTLSYDIEAVDAIAATSGSGYYRAGAELCIKNTSDTYNYYGKWVALSTSASYNFKGRLSTTFTMTSAFKSFYDLGIYIQGLGSGRVKVSNLKLEEGSKATPLVVDTTTITNPIEANQFYEL